MSTATPALLRASARHVYSQIFDSARWDGWKPRGDDIIISTYPKCGTTWTQRIVAMMVAQDAAPVPIDSPWFDMRLFGPAEGAHAMAESQTHRRYLKAHLPYDSLPIYEGVKIIHVARDGRDSAMSMHNHMIGFKPEMRATIETVNRGDPRHDGASGEVNPDLGLFFTEWLDDDGGARGDEGAGFFHQENSFWAARREPNVLLVHYNDLKDDREGEMARIARFLGIEIAESVWPEIVEAAGFAAMKRDAALIAPFAEAGWEGGAQRFIYKGVNGRWQDVVSEEDLARYDALVQARFTPALARWLEHGRLVAGDPETT